MTSKSKGKPTEADIAARKAWLTKPINRNFKQWASAIADKPLDWIGLELVIQVVLGVDTPKAWSAASKAACREVWDARGAGGESRFHTTSDELRSIGNKTAKSMLSFTSYASMKDEALEWARIAFGTLAPRLNSLAKKAQKRVKVESASDANSVTSGTTITTSTTAAIRQKKTTPSETQLENQLAPSSPTPTSTSISKKQKTNAAIGKRVSFEADSALPHKAYNASRPLCHRSIIVELEESLVEKESAVRYIIVGMSVVVNDMAQEQHHADIRCEHLSWEKFFTLMKETHPAYDIANRKLMYIEPTGVEEGESRRREIKDEADFRHAVGTLDWYGRQEGDSDVTPLRMTMINRYHY
ncbi:hypothetical protein EG329_008564 [Mollisiaceae sp. DMI_Dod_QoI]|nr:hypothetical protein EG329_008564 [Helotiales sp. DMI_Dod_QoI]